VILLLRTAHYNLAALRDVYLHTNTLAALANLAPHMHSLSSLAAQRLVSLFDMLARRRPQPAGPASPPPSHEASICAQRQLSAAGSDCWLDGSGCLLRQD